MLSKRTQLIFWVLLTILAVLLALSTLVLIEDIGLKVVFLVSATLGFGLGVTQIVEHRKRKRMK